MQTNTSYTNRRIIAVVHANERLLNALGGCNILHHEIMGFKNGYEMYSR